MRNRTLLGIASLSIALLSACAPGLVDRALGEDWMLRGQVVDADTGEPLSGAVVLVTWQTQSWIAMDGGQYFHEAKEHVVGDDGRFMIDATPSLNFAPLTSLQEQPSVVIVREGYGPSPASLVPITVPDPKGGTRLLSWPEEIDALRRGTIVRLPRLKGKRRAPAVLWPRSHGCRSRRA